MFPGILNHQSGVVVHGNDFCFSLCKGLPARVVILFGSGMSFLSWAKGGFAQGTCVLEGPHILMLVRSSARLSGEPGEGFATQDCW